MKNTLYIKYGFIIAAILFLLLCPSRYIYNGISLCLFREVTGILCPLCGMTRASYDLAHFRLASAMNYNPLVLFLPIMLVIEITYDTIPKPVIKKIRKGIFILFLISLVILFAVRIVFYVKMR